ncbi:FecR domain-containing protein [Rhodoferax sp. BLA1]|uniref:FecR family protein n=1 Tax=Rhodoferax sp. BLA1 TaxID=2576062 RepID=UPI001C5500CB|nr:FecR domain-containing protein [Rhodoferax sp. BLA1]
MPHRPSSPSSTHRLHTDEADEHSAFMAQQSPLDAAAAEWLVRRQDGLTPEEERQFQLWLAADERHVQAFQQFELLWERLPTSSVPTPAPVKQKVAQSRWRFGETLNAWLPQLSAAAIAFAVVSGGWWGWEQWHDAPTFTESYATVRGQQKKIRLPDGSQLWLDTATRAEVTYYRDRREVKLPEGQAQFAVQPDPEHPFNVLAGAVRVTVVGTRFSVRNTRAGLHEGDVGVVVEQGHVRVAANSKATASAHQSSMADLTAGQSLVANAVNGLGPVQQEDTGQAALWREGRVNFDNTPLAVALAEFGRYSDVHLVVRDPRVAALRISGSFDLRRLDAFERALPQVLPVRLHNADGVTEIVASRT